MLVSAYRERVIRTCFGFVRDEEEARDLAQEVFTEVFLSVKHFRSDASLSTWIYRISVNKSLDLIKRRNRKKRFAVLTGTSSMTPAEEYRLSDPAGDPSRSLEQKQERDKILKCLSKLPVNQRIAITLFYTDGLPQAEIASIMNTSVGAVESLLHRGKGNLKRIMNYELCMG